ncbi:MAG: chemotaxis response regulator protein-glutamate methylesterase [Burkholderiaceae bacterium]|jgi:two-component system chemotaxis response regulator CheB
MDKIKVIVIDDSALIRGLLSHILGSQPDIEVVGVAPHPLIARQLIKAHNPDVLTLDIEMPEMDGLEFLSRLMRLRPMPVVMLSTLTERGSQETLKALELGAVDFIAKPKMDIQRGMDDFSAEIIAKVRMAAKARVRQLTPSSAVVAQEKSVARLDNRRASTEKIIAIGASTGGTEAIREVLTRLPPDAPGIVITQHMPAGFTKSFAQRLDGLCRIAVKQAEHGERILPGHAYIAPGDYHLLLARRGADYVVALSDGEPVNRHRPSVEVLFHSVAQNAGPNAIGVMLTGMGKDGALAMAEMKRCGAYNLAQDEASCVVFGMPKEAIAAGGVDEILPVLEIGPRLIGVLSREARTTSRI